MAKADAEATFDLSLEGDLAAKSNASARALEALYASIQRDTKALSAMQTAMKRLQGANVVNVQQYKALQAQIVATKNRLAENQGKVLDLGGSLTRLPKASNKTRDALAELIQQARGVGGPLGSAAGKLEHVRGLVGGGALSAGLFATAAGFVALTAAAVAATAALLAYGIAQAEARRNELLHLEGLVRLRSWMGLAAGNAKELQEGIDRVSASYPIARDKAAQYTDELYRMGLRGENLQDALEGVAIKAATQGDAAAKRFAGLATSIALAGGKVKALANDVKARLGGIASAQMLGFGQQVEKLRYNLGQLFSGLKIDGFLQALHTVTTLFEKNTVTGAALRQLTEHIFQPMIGAVSSLMPLVKRFFQGMLIGALLVENKVLGLALWFKRTFGGSILRDLDLSKAAVFAGIAVVGFLTAAFVVLGTAIAAAVAPLGALVGSFMLAKALWTKVWNTLTGTDWSAWGRSIIDGIVNGIKGAASAVYEALKRVALGGLAAFKGALGIHSPSREFAKLGKQLPAGVESGIEQGSPSLEQSVSDMVQPSNAAPASSKASAGAALTVTFAEGSIVIHTDAKTASDLAQDLRQPFEDMLSGLLLQLGGVK